MDVDAGWLAGSATLLLIAFLANRIAFVNYYSMLMLLLLLLAIVLSPRVPGVPRLDPPVTSPTRWSHPHGPARA